jgi:signal transduction histidine kinase
VDVGALLGEIVALLHPPAGVRVVAEGPLPTLRTARAPLQQVLQNLIDNAIKHAGSDSVDVRVGAHEAGDWCELAVSDDGPGIPEPSRERVWELFHTLAPSDGERTGIGLAVVRRLVEGHGGRIWVESPNDRGGATFRFLWPRVSGG